jgi:hypothetical protein
VGGSRRTAALPSAEFTQPHFHCMDKKDESLAYLAKRRPGCRRRGHPAPQAPETGSTFSRWSETPATITRSAIIFMCALRLLNMCACAHPHVSLNMCACAHCTRIPPPPPFITFSPLPLKEARGYNWRPALGEEPARRENRWEHAGSAQVEGRRAADPMVRSIGRELSELPVYLGLCMWLCRPMYSHVCVCVYSKTEPTCY